MIRPSQCHHHVEQIEWNLILHRIWIPKLASKEKKRSIAKYDCPKYLNHTQHKMLMA